MSKLGVVHSGSKDIIPIGDRIALRLMLDDYRKGDFIHRRRCDSQPWAKYIYLEKRTYEQQIKDTLHKNPGEIFLIFDTNGTDTYQLEFFARDTIYYIRSLGYYKKIIVSAINEPLEKFSIHEIHSINKRLSKLLLNQWNTYLAVGEMATNFYDYYRSYLDCGYHYDYISYHTDNSCNLSNLRYFLDLFPAKTKFINNEHYHYNGSQALSYNNKAIVRQLESYTSAMFKDNRIKSIYICMPYHQKAAGKYCFLGLNLVERKTGKVYESLAWWMLKRYDIKEVIKLKLKEIGYGERGIFARTLQFALMESSCDPKGIDGIVGKKTMAALKEYNEDSDIKPVTTCTYETWLEMYIDKDTRDIIKALITFVDVM